MREIVAAGAVVFRGSGHERQVCLVHRPAYDDWAFPKGKRESGESTRVCAVREVAEEAALGIQLEAPLGTIDYLVSAKARKVVHWWRGSIREELEFAANNEIDQRCWLSIDEARDRLSYEDELDVLERAVATPPSTAIALVRHGKALPRTAWGGPDPWRPLNARGRNHAHALVPELSAYGFSTLVSSPSTRCRQTLGPYARSTKQCILDVPEFSEEDFEEDPSATTVAMHRLVAEALHTQSPTAMCGHRPVLPTMAEALGIPYSPLKTGQTLVAHVAAGRILNVEAISHTVDTDD